MPETSELVDVEALLVAHLKADAALDTAAGADRVGTELPSSYDHRTGAKWLQVFRVSGTEVDPATGHIDRALVQVHAYAGTSVAAFGVVQAAHRALKAAASAAHARGVVSAVERITGPSNNPDPSTSAPRYSTTYAVTVHPHPAA